MSRLLLVRHGQASFHADDYDRLSEAGLDQARHFARWWLSTGEHCDHVFVGTRHRQRQTADTVADELRAAGHSWPKLEVLPAFDEVKFETVVRTIVKDRQPHREDLQALARRYVDETHLDERPKAFVRLAEEVCKYWLAEREPISGSELWAEFSARVLQGLKEVRQRVGRGKTALAFTSAGPISAILEEALQCPPKVALRMWWKLANTSLTELLFTEDRLTLVRFNALPHLPDHRQWTYL